MVRIETFFLIMVNLPDKNQRITHQNARKRDQPDEGVDTKWLIEKQQRGNHADKPELYHDLPRDPRISTAIQGWKGWLKPVAAAAFLATIAGTLFHYVGVGAQTLDPEQEEEEEQA